MGYSGGGGGYNPIAKTQDNYYPNQ